MVNFQDLQKWGIPNILKEGKTFNLGDGKFSGIPKFNISKWRFQYFEMMARRWKFETLGKSTRRKTHKTGNRDFQKWH